MRRRCLWPAASLVLAVAGSAPLSAATVLERSEVIEIRPDGTVSERTHLKVRLDNDKDLDHWSPYPVYLDQNRTLESLTASATRPDGKVQNVARRALDTMEHAGDGELHSSRKFRTVTFPSVPVGSVLSLDYEVRERPYFPSGLIALASSDPIESLRVEVRGAGAGWRWRLDGKLPGLEVQEAAGGVVVTARSVPRISPPDLAPDGAEDGAVLRYAWGDLQSWEGVGRWYDRLVADVPRNAAAVREQARALIAGKTSSREKIEALLAFARRQVRYVAVEVGVGGFRPHTPQEVLERRWGDCKDKAFLLIDLLREAGIEAWPVLIQASTSDRVDHDFPSPNQFNHAIAAVAADGLGLGEDAPVAGGYLFLDATQTRGGLSWLQPADQDQDALIIRGGQGILVRTPVRHGQELSRLAVELAEKDGGRLGGEARLDLSGEGGAAFLDLVAAGRPEEVDRVLREVFGRYFPGGELQEPRITTSEAGVPSATLTTKVLLPGSAAAPEPGGWPVFTIPTGNTIPAPSLLEGRELPVVASPHISEVAWKVTLPQGACPPAAGQDVTIENALGGFRQTVSLDQGRLFLTRRTELRRRWIEPTDFAALKELSLAEYRSAKRRLRGQCKDGR